MQNTKDNQRTQLERFEGQKRRLGGNGDSLNYEFDELLFRFLCQLDLNILIELNNRTVNILTALSRIIIGFKEAINVWATQFILTCAQSMFSLEKFDPKDIVNS